MKNPFLIGTKVYLRPLEHEDAPAVTPWLNDPEVNRTLARNSPLNRLAEEEYIGRLYRSEQDVVLGVVVRATDRLIGVTGLHQIHWQNRSAAFGIVLGEKDEWGKGYGTEATSLLVRHAFLSLNLRRVWLHVYEYNGRGLRAYERAGFRREGVLRQEVYRDGRYWDTVVMAILRDEWDAWQPH